METELPVRRLDQFLFAETEFRNASADIAPPCGTFGGGQIGTEMPRFRGEQARVERAELRVEPGRQRGEPLAGARLDEGAGNQRIDQPGGLVRAHQLAKTARIARCRERAESEPAFLHDRQHLLEMTQLLPREA